MNKWLAVSVAGLLLSAPALAQEPAATGGSAGGWAAASATNFPLTVGIAVGTAALIGVAVNAAGGDDEPPGTNGANGSNGSNGTSGTTGSNGTQ